MTAREFAEWQVYFRLRKGGGGTSQRGRKTPDEQLTYVTWLNKIFGGKDHRERTG